MRYRDPSIGSARPALERSDGPAAAIGGCSRQLDDRLETARREPDELTRGVLLPAMTSMTELGAPSSYSSAAGDSALQAVMHSCRGAPLNVGLVS
jgi:hypothetical protein